ncbi:MAG: hypothetical protein ACE5FJ_00230 [Gemmatimonadales bacterium]
MGTRKNPGSQSQTQSTFDRARDELYSHILSCGVLEAQDEHQREWFDDTMGYLEERYRLDGDTLQSLRHLGEQFCRPVIRQS